MLLLLGGYASNGAPQSDGDLTNTTVSEDLYTSYHPKNNLSFFVLI